MNKREHEILALLHKELSIRKSEHPAIYGAWWILTELLQGRLGPAERLANCFLKVSEDFLKISEKRITVENDEG